MTRSQQPALTLFAVGMIGLGILALVYGDFAMVWQPVAPWIPGRTVLAYGSGVIMLLGGVGLLLEATAAWSARILFPYLIVWLLLKVPAHPWLHGAMDRASGHFRRYARSALGELANRTGFEVVAIAAMNPLAILPWLFKGRIRKRDANFSRTFSASSLKRINRLIPLLRFLDRVWPFPLGLSWVAALQKPRGGKR